jgi:hypothetical protein
VSPSALGKETNKGAHWWSLCRVLVRRALGKDGSFAECHLILSVKEVAKGLTGCFFAECRYSKQSAKSESCRVSPWHSAQSQSPSPDVVTMTFPCRVPSGTRQSLCQASDKKYSTKKPLPVYSLLRLLCRVFSKLCRVLQALSKATVSGNAG